MRHFTRLAFVLTAPLFAAVIAPSPIPRMVTQDYRAEGVFSGGGTDHLTNLARIRRGPQKGYERWVIDFSDEGTKAIGTKAPEFQVRYVKAQKVPVPNGEDILVEPPKFVFLFKEINKNHLKKEALQKLCSKSKYVKEIVLYPPVEGGDTAVEFLLNDSVLFEAHQPKEGAGRLVLDLKNAPLGS